MDRLRAWWWPAYAFVYPLLFVPGPFHLAPDQVLHGFVTLGFVGFGALLEWDSRPASLLTQVTRVPGALIRHPPALATTVLAVWVLGTAFLSPNPAIALTGSLSTHADGAVWQVVFCAVFLLAYVRTVADPGHKRRLAWAVFAAGVVLGVAALLEVLLGRSLFFTDIITSALPMATFPQKGHLAGMFALSGGVALALWSYLGLFLLSVAIGLAVNRAAMLALGFTWFGHVYSLAKRNRAIVTAALIIGGVVVGLGTASYTLPHEKAVGGTRSLSNRLLFWEDAVHGILARPITGWGGGVYELFWPNYLSKAKLTTFVRRQMNGLTYDSVYVSGGDYAFFTVHDASGRTGHVRDLRWKAHNEVLEAALAWGLVGLAIYGYIWGRALTGIARKDALAFGLLSYAIFLQFWFVIFETRGLVWVLLGAACVAGGRAAEEKRASGAGQRTGF